MTVKTTFSLFLFSALLLTACQPELDVPKPQAGNADFSKTIAVGGDFMAGYQDGALYRRGQQYCIPALLAEQFKTAGGGAFSQVLMPDDKGIGLNDKIWESKYITSSRLGYKTDCQGVSSLFPVRATVSAGAAVPYLSGLAGNSIQNFAVPYATLAQYFDPSFGDLASPAAQQNPFYNRIAGTPGVSTILSDAKEQHASFFTAWVGMEDIYTYAASGGTVGPIPSTAGFSMYLDSLLQGLTGNGAKGVIANIPDFRCFPYYTLVAWDNADITQSQADDLNDVYQPAGLTQIYFHQGRNGFIIDDVNANGGFRQMHSGEYITLSVPVDSMKCNNYGLLVNTISNRYALDSGEVYTIDQAINGYNSVIAQKAAQYNLALVDMHSFMSTVKTGIKWNGEDLNTEFVTGGFLSLDGYHPNQKGYALIANEFVKAINNKYNSTIPTINCSECNGVLFP